MWETFTQFGTDALDKVINLLPTSPFRPFIETIDGLQWISWLNWFVPIGTFLKILGAWGVCIALFYTYSIVLRWVKAID